MLAIWDIPTRQLACKISRLTSRLVIQNRPSMELCQLADTHIKTMNRKLDMFGMWSDVMRFIILENILKLKLETKIIWYATIHMIIDNDEILSISSSECVYSSYENR